jgi:hypothetical protein
MSKKVMTNEAFCPPSVLTSTVVRPYLVRFALEASAALASVFGVGDCSDASNLFLVGSTCTLQCHEAVKLTTNKAKVCQCQPTNPMLSNSLR